jgi:hypothetical protein
MGRGHQQLIPRIGFRSGGTGTREQENRNSNTKDKNGARASEALTEVRFL